MVSPNEVWARTGSKSVAINKYRINDLIFSMVHSRDASRRPAEPINLEREECPFQLPTQDTAQQPGAGKEPGLLQRRPGTDVRRVTTGSGYPAHLVADPLDS